MNSGRDCKFELAAPCHHILRHMAFEEVHDLGAQKKPVTEVAGSLHLLDGPSKRATCVPSEILDFFRKTIGHPLDFLQKREAVGVGPTKESAFPKRWPAKQAESV